MSSSDHMVFLVWRCNVSEDYKKLEDEEIIGGTYGQPIRNTKLVNTKMLKAKLNANLDKALGILTKTLDDENPKNAYKAATDILSYHVTLSNLEMKEDLHREEMKFRKHKNKVHSDQEEYERLNGISNAAGGTADIPQARFSVDMDETKLS